MGFGVNPLLIDTTAVKTAERHNFARPAPNDSAFSQTLVSTQQTPAEKTTGQKTNATSVKPSLSPRFNKSPAYFDNEDSDLGFSDIVDLLNPLQHIPLIGTLYREMTEDKIKPEMRVAGDIAYGALTGTILLTGAGSIASAVFEQEKGKEPAVQIAQALFNDDASSTSAPIALASTETTKSSPLVQASDKKPYGGVMTVADATAPSPASTVATNTPNEAQEPVKTETPRSVDKSTLVASAAPLPQTFNTTQMPRLGNKIYTGGAFKNATRLSAVNTAVQQNNTQASVNKTATALTANATASSALLNNTSDNKKLGQLMHQSAETANTNGSLPPQLVQDMMLMALDKYKTASGLAPSEMELNKLN